MDKNELSQIREAVEEFFSKMTIKPLKMDLKTRIEEKNSKTGEDYEVVELELKVEDPQILIGQQGQTLFEIQRMLRMVLNKKLQKIFYVDLDINAYKLQKLEYLKDLAKSAADQVALTGQPKLLAPMPAYERRIIHAELSKRTDIITESQGEGKDRHIVIKAK